MKRLVAAFVLSSVASFAFVAVSSAAPTKDKTTDLLQNLSEVGLGERSNRDGERKQFQATIALEKERLTRKMLKNVYENAYELYNAGNFDGARQLTSTILQIDPNYEEAAFLQKAAGQLQGSDTPRLSERRLAEEKFQDGLDLYRSGRVVEAAARWREVAALAPSNLKVRYWLRRANQDLAEEHFRRGQELYGQRRLRESLDQFYAAFSRDPKFPRLEVVIAEVEAEYQNEEASVRLQEALGLYGRGDLEGTAGLLKKVLELAPGNGQAMRLYAQVRAEIADKAVGDAQRLYTEKDYPGASDAWKRAASWGYDATAAQTQVAHIQEAQKRAEHRKKEEQRLAAKRKRDEAAEAKKEKEDEDKEEKDGGGKKKGGMTGIPGIQTISGVHETSYGSSLNSGETPAGGATPAAGPAPTQAPAAPATPVVTEENRKNSDLEFEKAMKAYQEHDLERASQAVALALQLNPANSDADSLRQRIEQARNQ